MAPVEPELIHLEGTTLEGGGQLFRIALGLSSLTKKPVQITKIRGKRSGGGGLKAQHLTSMLWLGQASNARISGAALKSKEITFTPHALPSLHPDLAAGHVTISQSTPGSISLVLQAVLPYLLFSGAQNSIHLHITGGTNVSNSPSIEYIEQVLLPMLTLIGIPRITSKCHSRGWSTGTTTLGSATFTISPLTAALPSFHLPPRDLVKGIRANILAPPETERDFRDTLDLAFEQHHTSFFPNTSDPEIETAFHSSHHSKRFYLLLVASTISGLKLGRDWLYDGGTKHSNSNTQRIIASMVRKVSHDLIKELAHGGAVDEWMSDQLVVLQALAQGGSRVSCGNGEGSLHKKTAMWVAERVVGARFDGEGGCEGVGFCPGGLNGGEEGILEGVRGLSMGG